MVKIAGFSTFWRFFASPAINERVSRAFTIVVGAKGVSTTSSNFNSPEKSDSAVFGVKMHDFSTFW